MPQSQIQLLNPSYKLNVVPFYQGEEHYIRLPKDKIATFVSNEDKIYAYVRHQSENKTMSSRLALKVTPKAKAQLDKTIYSDVKLYKVQKGDNLGAIAEKYDVNISDLKKWNNLRSNSVALGRTLKIKSDIDPVKISKEPKAAPAIEKKSEEAIAVIDDKEKAAGQAQEYVVVAGDNLGSIAKKFGTTIADLKELNNLTSNNIGLGKTLVISKEIPAIEETATVNTAIASNASIDSFKKKTASAKSMSEDYYLSLIHI